MALNQNQFAITPVAGDVDLSINGGNVISCQAASDVVTALVAGEAVKIEDSAGGAPKVKALTAVTNLPFGVIVRNMKDASYAANAAMEVALSNTVVFMTASAAFARGAALEYDYAVKKVKTWAGVNPIIGWAFDKAAADADVVRVYLTTQSYNQPMTLNQLSDVTITTPADTQVLKYNGTIWVNAADALV